MEFPDDKLDLKTLVVATDRITLVGSSQTSNLRLSDSIGIYGVGANDGGIWWHHDLTGFAPKFPMIGAFADAVFFFQPVIGNLVVVNDRTKQVRWRREGLMLDTLEPPLKMRGTKTNGNVLVAKTDKTIQAIRLSDGKDVWVVQPAGKKFTHIVTDDAVVIFDFDRRVMIVDLETGKTRLEIPVPAFTENLRLGASGSTVLAGGIVQGSTLYFQSKTFELYAVSLDGNILWHTPLKQQIMSLLAENGRVYTATEKGELLILDAASGAIRATLKIAPKTVSLSHADPDILVASSDKAVYGLDPASGKKRWEYPASFTGKQVMHFRGVVTVRTSEKQLSVLDAETGTLLWQYARKEAPGIFLTKKSFFIVEETGVKEYAVDLDPVGDRTISNREVLTELASALVSKGDLQQASGYLERVRGVDPHYAPMRAVRARLEKAKGNLAAAAGELAAFAGLVGRDSLAGQQAIAELKRNHGLLFHEPLDADVAGEPVPVADKLISVGRSVGGRYEIVGLNSGEGYDRVAASAGTLFGCRYGPGGRTRVVRHRRQRRSDGCRSLFVIRRQRNTESARPMESIVGCEPRRDCL